MKYSIRVVSVSEDEYECEADSALGAVVAVRSGAAVLCNTYPRPGILFEAAPAGVTGISEGTRELSQAKCFELVRRSGGNPSVFSRLEQEIAEMKKDSNDKQVKDALSAVLRRVIDLKEEFQNRFDESPTT